MSVNGTKDTVSSVTLYSLSVPINGKLSRICSISAFICCQSIMLGISSFTLCIFFHRFPSVGLAAVR